MEPNDDKDYGFFAWRLRLGLLFQSNFVDAFVEFYNLTKNLDVQFFYSHAFGNGVIEKIYPRGEDADFGYMEFNFKF